MVQKGIPYYITERGFDLISVRPKDTNEFTEIVHRRTGTTDEKDAPVIVRLTADGNYLGFLFRRAAYADLRQLVRAIDRTTTARTACVHRVRGALQLAWPEAVAVHTFLRFSTPTPSPRERHGCERHDAPTGTG